ncbi:chaperone modulator CbpM [Acidiphilium sp. AL]|uniref:Chaperone modulator CbpM n=1 Tax=Acidiphilium iwatense TaxID=768198 RepID=A0ABS9DUE9_9PROT|nr:MULTISPECIES: chaperone modulator CbpM [Acidiphilium]MCF3946352.1 chaperone modulator CbpM [Acidiphilium iwatense]MCU4159864.1 chaperone modulator CbpM [Acidiphilium sp. AL]
MITIEVLITRLPGLHRQDIERWIGNQWVRPDRDAGHYVFRDIDVARVRLIRELRDDLQVNEDALPVVLSLLDQLYDLRRRIAELGDAIARTAPDDLRRTLADHLAKL